jgi:DNA-binding PucR family transcriptional regulator
VTDETLHSRLEPLIAEMIASGLTLDQAVAEIERQFCAEAKRRHGSVVRAARALGIHRNTLMRLLPSTRRVGVVAGRKNAKRRWSR